MTGSPYPDGFSDIDRTTLSDAIDCARRVIADHECPLEVVVDALRELVARAEEAERQLKEYR